MEQSTLAGDGLSVEEVESGEVKCAYHEGGERCDYWAVVRVEAASGVILACPYHGNQSWLDAAGVNDHA